MTKLIDYICMQMIHHNIISRNQQEVLRYGLDLLLFSICSLISLLFVGLLVRKYEETILLLGTFIPLQSFGGGYHCRTHLRCYTMMLVTLFIALMLLMKLPIFCLWILVVLCVYPAFVLAPIQHVKAPFSSSFSIKMRRIERGCFLGAIIIATLIWRNGGDPSPILSGLILSGISITSAYVQSRLLQKTISLS